MTRKDYVLLAEALNAARQHILANYTENQEIALSAWEASVGCVADALASDNYRFDYARFTTACRGEA